MKTILIIGSALGLSASAAMADCPGHTPITAEAEIDRAFMTASIADDDQTTAPEEFLLLQKGNRVAEAAPAQTDVE